MEVHLYYRQQNRFLICWHCFSSWLTLKLSTDAFLVTHEKSLRLLEHSSNDLFGCLEVLTHDFLIRFEVLKFFNSFFAQSSSLLHSVLSTNALESRELSLFVHHRSFLKKTKKMKRNYYKLLNAFKSGSRDQKMFIYRKLITDLNDVPTLEDGRT